MADESLECLQRIAASLEKLAKAVELTLLTDEKNKQPVQPVQLDEAEIRKLHRQRDAYRQYYTELDRVFRPYYEYLVQHPDNFAARAVTYLRNTVGEQARRAIKADETVPPIPSTRELFLAMFPYTAPAYKLAFTSLLDRMEEEPR